MSYLVSQRGSDLKRSSSLAETENDRLRLSPLSKSSVAELEEPPMVKVGQSGPSAPSLS